MSGAALPNAHAAVVPAAKVVRYLLDATHPGNGGKAAFFNAFGFTDQNWHDLVDALQAHPGMHPVVRVMHSAWGAKYEIRCSLRSPDGRDPCVRSIWVIDLTDTGPRLVTAYAYP